MSNFDPANLEKIEEELNNIITIDQHINFDNKDQIYQKYFLLSSKIEQLHFFSENIKADMEGINGFLTHQNKDIQKIFYKSYMKLGELLKNSNEHIPLLEKQKELTIENFNHYFEKEILINE